MERFFEKISYDQFVSDILDDYELYEEYSLPKRATERSAGYDFLAMKEYVIQPGEIVKIPTGYKVKMLDDEVLFLVVRSSMGFKYNVRMCNQVGVIDADYYGNESNEGHIWVVLQNEGDKECVIRKGSAYCQGIFMKFLTCGDDGCGVRLGGIGSTDKEVRRG